MLLDFFFPVLFRARVSGNFVVRFRVVTRASTCISSLSLRQVLGQGGGGEGECISNSHVNSENSTYLIHPQNSRERQLMPVKDSLCTMGS